MGKRGPRPEPVKLRLVKGNPSRRPVPRKVELPPGTPAPPSWLGKEGLAEWRRVVPILEKQGILAFVDRAMIVGYCDSWERYVEAARDVQKRGASLELERERYSRNGDWLCTDTILVANPSVRIRRDSLEQCRRLAQEFGLTPASRLDDRSDADDEDSILDG